jgi:hypothetical protein
MGDLLFGTLQHFTATPPTMVATTLCRRIIGQVDAGQVYSFPRPPRVMQMLHFPGALPGATIYTARCCQESMEGPGTNSYFISGYFGSCHCYFQFSDFGINTNQGTDTLGHLTIQIEEIPGAADYLSHGHQGLDYGSARGRTDRRRGE